MKLTFWIPFFLILLLSFAIRIIPPQGNNFFFTVDQGNDAVHAREVFDKGNLVLKGPETTLTGVFAGPLWYYFISIGYFLFGGHPFGALFLIILLNVATTAIIMYYFARKISPNFGLFIGLALQLFWNYYDFSRYAFNPFPAIILTFWQATLINGFFEKKFKYYYLCVVPIFLAFNTAVAAAIVMILVHLLVGLWGVRKNLLTIKQYLGFNFVVPLVLTFPILIQLVRQVFKSSLFNNDISQARGLFTSTDFGGVLVHLGNIFSGSILPIPPLGIFGDASLSIYISVVLFSLILYFFLKRKSKHKEFVKRFLVIVGLFYGVSFLFYGSNQAWRDWHAIYLYIFTFISFFLLLYTIKRSVAIPVIAVCLVFQSILFYQRYTQYLAPSENVSMLYNRLAVIDWIYGNSEGDGFNVYTFAPYIYDYPAQYLFYWYGQKKYGFVPCEYTLHPGYLKSNYILSPLSYLAPTKGCDNYRFLVIEPGGDEIKYVQWRNKVAFERGEKVKEEIVGGLRVEKWRIIPRT